MDLCHSFPFSNERNFVIQKRFIVRFIQNLESQWAASSNATVAYELGFLASRVRVEVLI